MNNTKTLSERLVGQVLPSTYQGASGRGLEDLIESMGIPINRGPGIDFPLMGEEFKSRDVDAISPQTIGTISYDNLIANTYEKTGIYKKFQKQRRAKTKDNVIISADVYDFSPEFIQEKVKEAYEIARSTLVEWANTHPNATAENMPTYIAGTKWGYLERVDKTKKVFHYRVSSNAMKDFEKMSKSTYTKFF